MAGDWIKMRGSLGSHPKVLRIAAIIEESTDVGRKLSTGYNGCLSKIVTRDVTRDVTLASLLRVWCATNEHTSDGVWHHMHPEDLDHIAGIPGFGAAMELVGWAVYDEATDTTLMPNFLLHNAPAKGGRTNAERQKRYRERHKSNADSNATHNVTDNVTSNVEKRREEKTPKVPTSPRFDAFWTAYPSRRRLGKGRCLELWIKKGFEAVGDQICLHVAAMAGTHDWQKEDGKYAPSALTYLNQRRFEDGLPEDPAPRLVV